MVIKRCIECDAEHWTEPARCPTCEGIRQWRRDRYKNMINVGESYDENVFQKVFGKE